MLIVILFVPLSVTEIVPLVSHSFLPSIGGCSELAG